MKSKTFTKTPETNKFNHSDLFGFYIESEKYDHCGYTDSLIETTMVFLWLWLARKP